LALIEHNDAEKKRPKQTENILEKTCLRGKKKEVASMPLYKKMTGDSESAGRQSASNHLGD